MLRRALRHAFTILSALSLLLCVAACVLWVRSSWVLDGYQRTAAKSTLTSDETVYIQVVSDRGRVEFGYDRTKYFGDEDPSRPIEENASGYWHIGERTLTSTWAEEYGRPEAFGFSFWVDHRHDVYPDEAGGSDAKQIHFAVPYWSLAVITSVLPVWFGARYWRRHRKRGNNQCRRCGYDLRATPDRCPECGTPVQNAA